MTFGFRKSFISSYLTEDELSQVNARLIIGPHMMNLLLQVKARLHLWSSQRFFLLCTWMTLFGTLLSTNRVKQSFKTWTRLSADQMFYHRRSCIAQQTAFKLIWCFRKTFQVMHKFGTAFAIEMTAYRDDWPELHMGDTTATYTRTGTSVTGGQQFHYVYGSCKQLIHHNQTQSWCQWLQYHYYLWS